MGGWAAVAAGDIRPDSDSWLKAVKAESVACVLGKGPRADRTALEGSPLNNHLIVEIPRAGSLPRAGTDRVPDRPPGAFLEHTVLAVQPVVVEGEAPSLPDWMRRGEARSPHTLSVIGDIVEDTLRCLHEP